MPADWFVVLDARFDAIDHKIDLTRELLDHKTDSHLELLYNKVDTTRELLYNKMNRNKAVCKGTILLSRCFLVAPILL